METTTQIETATRLAELAPMLAKELGGAPLKVDHDWYAKISTDTFPLVLDLRRHDGRLVIRPDWPTYRDVSGTSRVLHGRDYMTPEERNTLTTEITVNVSRGVSAIARDIRRRLLSPPHVALYTRLVERAKEYETYERETAALADRLTERFPYTKCDSSTRLYGSGSLPTIDVTGSDHVRFESMYVSAAVAEQIIAILVAAGGEE